MPAKHQSFDPSLIRNAVSKAGFSPGEVELTAVGVLSKDEELLVLEMSGPMKKMVLAGGERAEELSNQPELIGQRVRVTGNLHPSHADKPPGLTVESWVPADLSRE